MRRVLLYLKEIQLSSDKLFQIKPYFNTISALPVQHGRKSHTLTNLLRQDICMEKQRRHSTTQEALVKWMMYDHEVTIKEYTQIMIQ